MYQKKSGFSPFVGVLVLIVTVFFFVFASPQTGDTSKTPGWYQSVENIIAPVGHNLDQRFGPSKKGGSINTSAGVMSWR